MPVRQRLPDLQPRIDPVRLYLDDLEELDTILRKAYPTVSLQAGAVDVDTVGELHEVQPEDLRELVWFALDGLSSLYLHISPVVVSLRARRCDISHRGALAQIEDLMRRRRRKLATLSERVRYLSLLVFLALTGVVLDSEQRVLYAAWIPTLAWFWYTIWAMTHKGVVVLERRREQRSWWRRNRDALVVGLVVAVVSAVLGSGITYLLTR